MKRILALLLSLAAAASNAPAANRSEKADPVAGQLRWKNGESIPGQIGEASASELTWKSPLFDDPVILRWSALERIDHSLNTVAGSDPFGIALRDGSFILGDVASISADAIAIHSARHGDVTLRRSEVLSIRRLHAGPLRVAGPVGDVGWKAIPKPGDPDPSEAGYAAQVIEGPSGALSLPFWRRSAFLKLALPDRVDVEFLVRSPKRPDFVFSFIGDKEHKIRVETWDEELVLTTGDEFKPIRKMNPDEREIGLRVCWDVKAGKCSVYTREGEFLTDWQPPKHNENSDKAKQPPLPGSAEEEPVKPNNDEDSGLSLRSKCRALSLDFLRVREWDGNPPPTVEPKELRVELADGRVIQGPVIDASTGGVRVQTRDQDSEESFPLEQVGAMYFSTDAPKVAETEASLAYADGTYLAGRILSIHGGQVALQTSFSEAPLNSQVSALRLLRIHAPAADGAPAEPSLDKLDQIVIQRKTLHGRFTASGGDRVHWTPVGGVKAVTPAKTAASEITRAMPADAAPLGASSLFYTASGDVLPGKLLAVDRAGVELESRIIEAKKLPAGSLDAVQFDVTALKGLTGFDDPAWRILKGTKETVKTTHEKLEMEPDTAIAHPIAMQASEINFKLNSEGFTMIRLRLFCSGTDFSKSTNLFLVHSGNQMTCGLEVGDNEIESEMQIGIDQRKPPTVQLTIQAQKVEVRVNRVLMGQFEIDREKRMGTGLIIEPASVWGNQAQKIALSDFSATFTPGSTWTLDVTQETRTQVRTVPRFRKDDPPRQALLAANGDMLRGEIEAATTEHFGFRSGLENLRIPRDRVKAAIWLKKPDEFASPVEVDSAVTKLLRQRIENGVWFQDASLQTYTNFLQQQASELKFKLPKDAEDRRLELQFGNQTLAVALEKICTRFGMQYRVEGDTIVIEPANRAPRNLVQRVYWLKPGVIPSTPPLKDALTAKGIAFPDGASVQWQPESGQLVMTNSSASQDSLAKIIEADFGGSLGSPTHWLVLLNGARIGLVVDKFEEETISGHHPVYGQCRIPVSQVCAIYSAMPAPNEAMKSFSNWRLAYAPEPVIPGAGGGGSETSASLGKPAAGFKLPLLAGGEFELGKEKGKVVVLDFWATWCGPCIKSLPGLIEAMSAFPSDRVKLIGVNQGEGADEVKQFLATRGWKLNVAMDSGTVARQYGVDGIPHTVIVGPDGKIAWVKTGYTPDGDKEAAAEVTKLLGTAPTADSTKDSVAPAAVQ